MEAPDNGGGTTDPGPFIAIGGVAGFILMVFGFTENNWFLVGAGVISYLLAGFFYVTMEGDDGEGGTE